MDNKEWKEKLIESVIKEKPLYSEDSDFIEEIKNKGYILFNTNKTKDFILYTYTKGIEDLSDNFSVMVSVTTGKVVNVYI